MGVCDEASKTPRRLVLTPKEEKDELSACGPGRHLNEDQAIWWENATASLQRVS